MKKFVTMAAIAISSQAAWAAACSQNSNSLGSLVGLDSSSGTVYATITSGSNECACAYARFSPSNTDAKAALSILLSAKLANKAVRIDFLDTASCDSAFRVYVH